MTISLLVQEKISERFLPYMGMAAIFVKWPGPHEQTINPPSHGRSTWNPTSIGPVVSEEKMFENDSLQTTRTKASHTFGSGELKTTLKIGEKLLMILLFWVLYNIVMLKLLKGQILKIVFELDQNFLNEKMK